MLRAKGIPYVDGQRGPIHSLWVNDEAYRAAVNELRSYERENANWPPAPEPAPPRAPYAMHGGIFFAGLLIMLHLLDAGQAFGLDWSSAGVAHARAILDGEPWRAMTALFLHGDVPHILSNLIFGLFFGFLVAIGHGGGLGWLAILLAGTLGNFANALIQSSAHYSVGASTAVFGALGVLAGSEWRRRLLLRQGGMRRAAPVLLGVTALAMYGVPQQPGNVDVGAHVMGFCAGLGIGAFLPYMMARGLGSARFQRYWGLCAFLLVTGAWALALRA